MNYSGNASFEYEIERYKDSVTGELLEEQNHMIDNPRFDYQCIPVQITGRAFFQNGSSYGLADNSYPEESDVELISAIGPDNKDWLGYLNSKEQDQILNMIIEEVFSTEPEYNEPNFE